ncbi:MAG: protein kinase, partial [Verrucomicrobia bacterium]|nr:protein kinase [Verrucomicrobiota bacterium]
TGYTSFQKRKRLPFTELLTILSTISKTIAEMHTNGVVHQDIKVKNVLYRKDEQGNVEAKLIDFGHSYRPSKTRATNKSNGHHYGTVRYSSPELLNTESQLPTIFEQRKAEDMYALGCLIYELSYQKPLPWDDDMYVALKDSSVRDERGKLALSIHNEEVEKLLESSRTAPGSILSPQKQLEQICAHLLDSNPKTRFTIAEFQAALEKITSNP